MAAKDKRIGNLDRMIKLYEESKSNKGADFASDEDLNELKSKRDSLVESKKIKSVKQIRDAYKKAK